MGLLASGNSGLDESAESADGFLALEQHTPLASVDAFRVPYYDESNLQLAPPERIRTRFSSWELQSVVLLQS